jgi:putative transposase
VGISVPPSRADLCRPVSAPPGATVESGRRAIADGSYFPDWLLERRKRAEAALTSMVATCHRRDLSGQEDPGVLDLGPTTGIHRQSQI